MTQDEIFATIFDGIARTHTDIGTTFDVSDEVATAFIQILKKSADAEETYTVLNDDGTIRAQGVKESNLESVFPVEDDGSYAVPDADFNEPEPCIEGHDGPAIFRGDEVECKACGFTTATEEWLEMFGEGWYGDEVIETPQ